MENNFGGLGSGSVRIWPADGGGSMLHADWSNGAAERTRDRILLGLLHRGPMNRVIARRWGKQLDRRRTFLPSDAVGAEFTARWKCERLRSWWATLPNVGRKYRTA